MSENDVMVRDIYIARRAIASVARRTPLISSPSLTEYTGASIYLKLENLQVADSFKVRGVANKLLNLTAEEKARGVVAFSTGNHGRAVACVSAELGIRAVICVSNRVPGYRIDAIKRLGAGVEVIGKSQDEAMARAYQLQKEQGLSVIHAFDDPFIIAGHGTIGLELLEDLPEVDTVIVPLSGGALVGGIALAVKSANSAARAIGVSMASSPTMYRSLQAGKPIEIEEKDSIADALLGGVDLNNKYTFRMVQDIVDDVVLLTEEEIAEGMFFALNEHHLVVEGAGAVGIGALLARKVSKLGKKVVVVISGGNASLPLLMQIAQQGNRKTKLH